MSILVDESEPEYDVEDPPFEPRNVKVRKDKWVTDEYDIQDFLGRGKFGEVNKCREKTTDNFFAAKFISAPTAQDKKEVEHEIEIMKRLQHKRLLQLYDAFQSRNEMCLVLEIILGGELFDRVICDDFILTERACVMFMRQICEGMAYMHTKHILHLDMKPENILCLSKTGNRIKIIDFGLARDWTPKSDLRVMFGTAEFMAPEVVNYEPISPATDMWSVGVISYVLLSGLSPFMGDNDGETLSNVIKGDYDFDYPEFEDVSEDAKSFISKLLILDKAKRMTATDALEHPWLRKQPRSARKKKRKAEPTLSKTHLRKFVFRRKWQKAVNAMVALRRMGVNLTNSDFSKPPGAECDTLETSTAASNAQGSKDVTSNAEDEKEPLVQPEKKPVTDKEKDSDNNNQSSPSLQSGEVDAKGARKVSSGRDSGSSADRSSGYNTLKRYERKKDASKGKINIQDHRPIDTPEKSAAPSVEKKGTKPSSQPEDAGVKPVKKEVGNEIISNDLKSNVKESRSGVTNLKSEPDKSLGELKEDGNENDTATESPKTPNKVNTDDVTTPNKTENATSKLPSMTKKSTTNSGENARITPTKIGVNDKLRKSSKEPSPVPYMTKTPLAGKLKDEKPAEPILKDDSNDIKDGLKPVQNRLPSPSPHRNFRSNLNRKSADKDSVELSKNTDSVRDGLREKSPFKREIFTPANNVAAKRDLLNKRDSSKDQTPSPKGQTPERNVFKKTDSSTMSKKSTELDVNKTDKYAHGKENDESLTKTNNGSAFPLKHGISDLNSIKTSPFVKLDKDSTSKSDLPNFKSKRDDKKTEGLTYKNDNGTPKKTETDKPKTNNVSVAKTSDCTNMESVKPEAIHKEPPYSTPNKPGSKFKPLNYKQSDFYHYKIDDNETLKQTNPPHYDTDRDIIKKEEPTRIHRKSVERLFDDANTTLSLVDNVLVADQDSSNRSELTIQIADKTFDQKMSAADDPLIERDVRQRSEERERSKSSEKEYQAKILSNVLSRFVERDRSRSLSKERSESIERERVEIKVGHSDRAETPPTIIVKQKPPAFTESKMIKVDVLPRDFNVNTNASFVIRDSTANDVSTENSSDEMDLVASGGRPGLPSNVSRLVSNLESTGKFPYTSDSSSEDDNEKTTRQTVRLMSRNEPGVVQRITLGGGGVHRITIGGGGARRSDTESPEPVCSAPRFTAMRMKTSDASEASQPSKNFVSVKNSLVTERFLRPNLTSKRFNIGSKQYVQMFDTDQGQVVQRFDEKSTPAAEGRQSSSFRQFIRKFETGDSSPKQHFEVSNVKITSNSSRFKIYESDKGSKK